MQKILLAITFVLLMLVGFAQEFHNTDSLQHELQKFEAHKKLLGPSVSALTDTTKINLWYELVRAYWCSPSDSGTNYARQCLSLSENIGYKKGVGDAYNGIGIILLCRHEPKQAIDYFQKALKIRGEINDLEGMAWTYNNLGLAYGDAGNYPQSLISHSNALKIRTDVGDKELMEVSYSKRGFVYEMFGDYPHAIKDYLNALKMAEETGSKMRVAENYKLLAAIYDKMGNYPEALKNYSSSSKIALEIGDKTYLAMAYFNMGDICYKQSDYQGALKNYLNCLKIREENNLSSYDIVYSYNKVALAYSMLNEYPEALKYCFKASQFYEKLDARYMMAFTYNLIGEIYEKQGNLNEALKYENHSLLVAEEAGARDIKEKDYESLAAINARLKNYKAAYDNEILFKREYDTLYNKESERKITGLQMQFAFNQQQDSLRAEQLKKDNVARQQIERQQAYLGIGIGGFILLAILLFFVFRNYTSQRKATAAMAVAKMKAEQSEKFKEMFLANMSHEIRTPMNAVLGMANLMLDRPLDEKQKNYVEAIKESSENLLVILNDILDLSKLEAGKMHLEKLPFQLRSRVTYVMDMMKFKAEEKGLLFTADVAADVPAVLIGDAARLNAVLLNLLGNAIKFTDKGFVKLEVSIAKIPTLKTPFEAEALKTCTVEFKIKDSGIGISEEHQQRIFESFEQGDNGTSRRYGGTGLGLTISKTLIELQGGAIAVKSEPGKSSEFSFTIPYQVGDESDLMKPEENEKADFSPLTKLKLLIVEDDELNQVVIKDTLQKLAPGIEIAIAANGRIAVEMVRLNSYGLILMDIQMPEMDGYEATEFMRNNLKLNIPIVALTASVIRSDLDKCFEAGMNGYIPKPFKRAELLKELMKHVPSEKLTA